LSNTNTQRIIDQINTAVNSVFGAVGALATLANNDQGLQLTAAVVVAAVLVGSGSHLAFTLEVISMMQNTTN
jgi:hypothetical protein